MSIILCHCSVQHCTSGSTQRVRKYFRIYLSYSNMPKCKILKSIYLLKHAKCKILKSIYLLKHAKCKILKSTKVFIYSKLRISEYSPNSIYSKILVTKYSIPTHYSNTFEFIQGLAVHYLRRTFEDNTYCTFVRDSCVYNVQRTVQRTLESTKVRKYESTFEGTCTFVHVYRSFRGPAESSHT